MQVTSLTRLVGIGLQIFSVAACVAQKPLPRPNPFALQRPAPLPTFTRVIAMEVMPRVAVATFFLVKTPCLVCIVHVAAQAAWPVLSCLPPSLYMRLTRQRMQCRSPNPAQILSSGGRRLQSTGLVHGEERRRLHRQPSGLDGADQAGLGRPRLAYLAGLSPGAVFKPQESLLTSVAGLDS
jgi:hypothetical protein